MTAENEIEPDFLSSVQVAVLGLGLMGGSLAMALRGKCKKLLGIDPNLETLKLAERLAICDQISDQPSSLLPQADLIILAAPINIILDLIHNLPDLTPGCPIVMDLGSTKVQIVRAMQDLPARFDPIGAHPMCGKERSSLEQAESGLFKEAAFALVPLPRTSSRARKVTEQLVKVVGAHPIWINEMTHDRWVAATSHIPFIIANALASSTPAEAAPMVGPGYRSTTRVSTSPASVMLDILSTNRANILDGLGRFRTQLDHLETLLREDNQAELVLALDAGAARQKQILIASS
jgi:prephenate dehydrogenase